MQCLNCLKTNDQNVSLYLKRKTNIACGNQLGNKPKFYQWLGIKLSQILNWIATFDMWQTCKEYKGIHACQPCQLLDRVRQLHALSRMLFTKTNQFVYFMGRKRQPQQYIHNSILHYEYKPQPVPMIIMERIQNKTETKRTNPTLETIY